MTRTLGAGRADGRVSPRFAFLTFSKQAALSTLARSHTFRRMIRRRLVAALVAAFALVSRASAQQGGAAELGELIHGLGVNTRVLVIGAHPDDEDTQLITWLARGRQVETAYLSLTRGDGGQNLLGNELGEAL